MQTINMDPIKTVCGVVVLYNPQKDVIDNINSYIEQINFLFIIDNSNSSSEFVKLYYKSLSKVEYIFNNNNIGVAAALNIGAQKAIASGYRYLLTMDQDSKAPSNLVESLLKNSIIHQNIGIVSPLHSNKFGTHNNLNHSKDLVRVMSSGNLLLLNAYEVAGGFCDDYFIDYVDIEYCMRLYNFGYKIIQLDDVFLEHNEADISEKELFNKKYYPTNNPYFRWYYKTRNLLYLRNKYKKIFPNPCREELKVFIRNVVKILLFEEDKILKIKMILVGVVDYLKKKKGRRF